MIHPINPPIFMAPARSASVYESDPESADPETPSSSGRPPRRRPAPLSLFDRPADEYVDPGYTYTADGRRLRHGVPTTPLTPSSMWSNVFRRSLINRFRERDDNLADDPPIESNDGKEEDDEGTDQTDDAMPIRALRFPAPLYFEPKPKRRPPLDLKWVDLDAWKNAVAHHTEEFEVSRRKDRTARLVIRRGQEFHINLRFYRNYDPKTDKIQLVFELGRTPAESKGTRSVLEVDGDSGWGGWKVESEGLWGNRGSLRISTPASAVIGCWTLKIVTITRGEERGFTESICPVEGIYLLFNPWAYDDAVYLPNAEERDEYVLNDTGKIWRGSHNALQPTVWSYGQFEDGILESVMILLELAHLPLPLRASPIHVSRAISQMVNSKDDQGVLQGNWSGNFADGTPPTQWTGSGAILRTFAETGRPVRYGQCWVFAGVVNTVLRCLGIPGRVVTNYSSAHDTDNSCTVDIHFSKESGKLLKEYNGDSVWNFHVWNDCWMERPDLPKGYGGWQAIDATPQEKSEGIYRAGPASHRAIKEGEVAYGYDTAFIFSEVQADKCYWLVDYRQRQSLNEIKEDGIGRMIITKRPGKKILQENDDLMDVTGQYKHYERTDAERRAVKNALLNSHSLILQEYRRSLDNLKDVQFELDLHDSVMIGSEFLVTIRLKNLSKQERTIKVSTRVNTALYTGRQGRKVKSDVQQVSLLSGERKNVELSVSPYHYLDRLMDMSMFVVSILGHVYETDQVFATTDDCRLTKPKIQIEVPRGTLNIDYPFKVGVKVRNPLPVTLTNCKFVVEGSGLMIPKTLLLRETPAYGTAAATLEIRPWRAGVRNLLVHFNSDQLQDVEGSEVIEVDPHMPRIN